MGQEDIPDEQGIGYSPMKYVMGVKAILEPKNYPPSSFVKVEKSQYHEGWLLLLTCTSPPEYKVLYTHQKKYGMLVDKVFYVFDEDKLHLRQPLLTLNFDLNCFYIEESDKKSLEFK
jgi:hypothetical protein